jgi:hypothetical protein
LLNEALPDLIQQAIVLARDGDFGALKLCIERCIPVAKDGPIALQMGAVNSLDDISKALSDIVTSVASGELTPSEGSSVAGLIELRRQAIEMINIESRLHALEETRERALPNGHGLNGNGATEYGAGHLKR